MSLCLPSNGKSGLCQGCKKPVRDDKVDPKWYLKPHITVEIALAQRPLNGTGQMHNSHYNFCVHGIPCMKLVDWDEVEKDIFRCETELMNATWKSQKEMGMERSE